MSAAATKAEMSKEIRTSQGPF